jgi:hypothetical protein
MLLCMCVYVHMKRDREEKEAERRTDLQLMRYAARSDCSRKSEANRQTSRKLLSSMDITRL